tara:strand:- start:5924 stop:6187 length:264 start_codon:yes stop_codon:yes gene_type:complete
MSLFKMDMSTAATQNFSHLEEYLIMNNDIIKGKWKQASGSLKARWGKLTDDDLQEIDGKLEKFQGKMQEKYGMAKDEAKKEFDKSHS